MRFFPVMRSAFVRPIVAATVVLGSLAIVVPVPAHAQDTVAEALASNSIDVSKATNVAPVKDGRRGVTFTVYASPDTSKPVAKIANSLKISGRVVFTVIEDLDDWLKVNAPMRANGGVGYIKASILDNRFNHDWRIRVSISARQLTLTKGSTVILTDKVAVGKAKTPTPLGSYYTVDLIQSRKPKGAYGPFAYGLSAYSPVYQKFGTGDGRIGLHGTNEPAVLGQAVSDGCIRISNATILKLTSLLPLGVPVDIVD